MKCFCATIFLFFLSCTKGWSQKNSLKLWYTHPADALTRDGGKEYKDDAEWVKALPLGNGNIGAMIFGDVNNERIQLNEKTLWSGSYNDNDNPDAPGHISEIRKLLFEGKFKEATELTNNTQVCVGVGSGYGKGAEVPFGCFQTLGDLHLSFESDAAYTNYYRDLDLNTAIASVRYTKAGVIFHREYFISSSGTVMVIKLSANRKGAISFSVLLDRPEHFTVTGGTNKQLIMYGSLNNGKGGNGMEYMVRLRAKLKGGKQFVENNKLVIKNADEVVLYLTASTDYLPVYPVYKGRDYKKITAENLDKALVANYQQLKRTHIADYQKYFKSVALQLSSNEQADDVPTDERLKQIKIAANDNYLTQLYFQYGRYLLITSSREGTLPANLQGIWGNKIQTPWNGDYHTNINIQMNYWLAENTNLSDLHLPMINFIKSIEKPATRSAKVQFGKAGWCVNPIVNVWGFTSTGEVPSWGLTTGASGWICEHLWEHYAFTKDSNYLRSVYATLKNAAKFYLDWLVKDEATGKLVSGPASSQENSFIASDGYRAAISMGPSHDQEIIEELFTNVINASLILKDKDEFVDKIKKTKANLLKPAIGDDGRIMEWAKSYIEPEPGHRHLSHLYALYPGNARVDGTVNEKYAKPFTFTNDFFALLNNTPEGEYSVNGLLKAKTEKGICRVISFSPRHDLTLPLLEVNDLRKVVDLWQKEFIDMASNGFIRYIQVFENKGEIMGCSNPRPHGQIWATSDLPVEIEKETQQQLHYYWQHQRNLLSNYLQIQLELKERMVTENDDFVALVPFWAVWPYETMLISKRHVQDVAQFTEAEKINLSSILKTLLVKYDNLFEISFPYSGGMHQQPVNDGDHNEWHWHMHFYPPLLRSATVKKFMVGYEMLANPQRDITPEAAATLRNLSDIHYKR